MNSTGWINFLTVFLSDIRNYWVFFVISYAFVKILNRSRERQERKQREKDSAELFKQKPEWKRRTVNDKDK